MLARERRKPHSLCTTMTDKQSDESHDHERNHDGNKPARIRGTVADLFWLRNARLAARGERYVRIKNKFKQQKKYRPGDGSRASTPQHVRAPPRSQRQNGLALTINTIVQNQAAKPSTSLAQPNRTIR